MKRKTIILSILSVVGLGSVALASPNGKAKFEPVPVSKVDTDGDGMISATEMRSFMQSMRATHKANRKANRKAMISQWDANNDGKLDKSERALIRASRFAKHDANGDGGISLAEAAGTRMAKRFERLDADGDGLVSESEYAAQKRGHKGRRGGKGKAKRGKKTD